MYHHIEMIILPLDKTENNNKKNCIGRKVRHPKDLKLPPGDFSNWSTIQGVSLYSDLCHLFMMVTAYKVKNLTSVHIVHNYWIFTGNEEWAQNRRLDYSESCPDLLYV